MNIFDTIYKYTNIHVDDFLREFLSFIDNEHNDIISYYTDWNISYPQVAFNKYEDLLKRCNYIYSKLSFHKGKFNNLDYWNLFEEIEEIKHKLELIPSYPRFYKVSFVKQEGSTGENFETMMLKQNQTVEQLANEINQDENDIMLLNYLTEEEWNRKGGKKIVLKETNLTEESSYVAINSIIDICLGSNLLGKDLPEYVEFNEDGDDLVVCSPERTYLNSVKRVFSIIKGSIPEFPNVGVSKEQIQICRGETENVFPIVIRQLEEALQTDDTIIAASLINIEKIEGKTDAFQISYEVHNRLREPLVYMSNMLNDDSLIDI